MIYASLLEIQIMYRMSNNLKSILKDSMGAIYKLNPFLRYRIKNGLTIFVFHEVSDNPSEFTDNYGLTVSISQFIDQITWIKNNFNIVDPAIVLTENSSLPSSAAIITFDDGFLGTFENGFPILKQFNIPILMFLNMKPILDRSPMLSALVCYLFKYNNDFKDFVKKYRVHSPYHLSINPNLLKKFLNEGHQINYDQINNFQGELVNQETLSKWDKEEIVNFSSHFFDHWNAAALSSTELEDQYILNENELVNYSSYLNLLAFTNGKPNSCFNQENIKVLKDLGVTKLFSSVNGINKSYQSFLLGRLSINQNDISTNHLWYRLGETSRKINIVK